MARQSFRKLQAVFIAIVVVILSLSAWLLFRPSTPRLSVTFLRIIHGIGNHELRFGITNVGHSTVFTFKMGYLEVFGRTNQLMVGATAPMTKLAPGEGHEVHAVLSDPQMASIDGRWRYTCLYAENGFQTRFYHWRWGTNGPGARINWLVPKRLEGIRLTVKGTSDWIDDLK